MDSFRKKTAQRIAIVSLTLAAITAPLAGLLVSEQAEEATVKLAMEESRRRHWSAACSTSLTSMTPTASGWSKR